MCLAVQRRRAACWRAGQGRAGQRRERTHQPNEQGRGGSGQTSPMSRAKMKSPPSVKTTATDLMRPASACAEHGEHHWAGRAQCTDMG